MLYCLQSLGGLFAEYLAIATCQQYGHWPRDLHFLAVLSFTHQLRALSVLHQESEDAVKALAKEKDMLEREKWDLRRQTKEATEHTGMLRTQLDLKENRIKELEAELAMVR